MLDILPPNPSCSNSSPVTAGLVVAHEKLKPRDFTRSALHRYNASFPTGLQPQWMLDSRRHIGERSKHPIAEHSSPWGQSTVELSPNIHKKITLPIKVQLLLQLIEAPQWTLFSQIGHYRKEDYTTFSFGLGQRYLLDQDWLLGYNLFCDFLRQGDHKRMGVGVEVCNPYIMLSANLYLPLSRWKSTLQDDLLSQPAKGIDCTVVTSHPNYPQWSVTLSTEHYFNIQTTTATQSPEVISPLSVGLNYTPCPLIKMGYCYRIGSKFNNHQQQHKLAVTLHYRFGIPFNQQLDASKISTFLSVNQKRLDPVQRNIWIYLNHKTIHRHDLIEELARFTETTGKWNSNMGDIIPIAVMGTKGMQNHQLCIDTISWVQKERPKLDEQGEPIVDPHGNPVVEKYREQVVHQVFIPAAADGQVHAEKPLHLELKDGHYKVKDGSKTKDVPRDGDCFFHALSQAMGLTDSSETIAKLRREAAEFIRKHPEQFEDYVIPDKE